MTKNKSPAFRTRITIPSVLGNNANNQREEALFLIAHQFDHFKKWKMYLHCRVDGEGRILFANRRQFRAHLHVHHPGRCWRKIEGLLDSLQDR